MYFVSMTGKIDVSDGDAPFTTCLCELYLICTSYRSSFC